MNRYLKKTLVLTLLSLNAILFKSSGKEESNKDIIYNYYDNNDFIMDSKIFKIIENINKYYDVSSINLTAKDDVEAVLLLKAVIDNNNLTEAEKQICYQFLPFYLDYNDLDWKGIYERLLTLDIDYSDKTVYVSDSSIKAATYYPDYNYIICYNNEKPILQHEIFHAIMPMSKFPKAIKEGLVSTLTFEYFDDNSIKLVDTYQEYMALTKSFLSIIDNDLLVSLASYDDIYSFKDELKQEGTISSSEINSLFDLLDSDLNTEERNDIAIILLDNFGFLENNKKALENLRKFTLYNGNENENSDYYFNKSKIKELVR